MPDVQNGGTRSDTTGCCCFKSHKHKGGATNGMQRAEVASAKRALAVAQSDASLVSTTVPYSTPVPSDLKAGKCIHIRAAIQPRCTRFSVNLLCGLEPAADIALHVNPRLSQRYVVRNCRLGGKWGEEECTSIQPFNFRRNQPFLLTVLMAEREFLISLDGRHLCAYSFRVPLNRVGSVELHGALDVTSVEFADMQTYPDYSPVPVPIVAVMGDQAEMPEEQDNAQLEVPTTMSLPDGLRPGWQLEVHGRVKILPHSFCINLQEGHQLWPHPTIHLHLNPRFSTNSGEFVFVRNSWVNGSWGAEESVHSSHFTPGQKFVITVWRTPEVFSVWVDGKLAGEFAFRGNAENINTVYVQGDVVLKRILLTEKNLAPVRYGLV